MRTIAKKLLQGGLASLVGSAIAAFIPFLGYFALSTSEYAIWALAATISTILMAFDFGANTAAVKLASDDTLSSRALASLLKLTMVPALGLSVLVALAWPLYSRFLSFEPAANSAQTVFLGVGLGTALRSAGVLIASIYLGRELFALRAFVLVGGAVAQLLATWAFLSLGYGAHSLGLGLICAGVAQLMIGAARGSRDLLVSQIPPDSFAVSELIRSFVKTRGAAAALGLSVTQLDRWIVGALAPPATLATYDLVVRAISVPKIILLALGTGLISAAGRMATRQELVRLWRFGVSCNVVAMGLSTAAVVLGLLWTGIDGLPIWMTAALIAGHAVNALTIAPSMILLGRAQPGRELGYLVPLFILVALGASCALYFGSFPVFLIAWSASMVTCSLYFLGSASKWLVYESSH